ncbi:MAG: autotransporter domain-containing protein [Sphingomonas sp.]|nr:autotransporter domain-containing protein [Sphingomonas sp.]
MKTKLLATTIIAAAAIAATPAQAQRVDRVIAFGDSYADDGNLFELIGVDPITTGAYTTGRFSGGSNYIDTLSALLDVPVDNYAIGGARAVGGNTNSGGLPPTSGGIPGFPSEVGIFLSGGGGVFPTGSGTFGPNDLVAINIGGNDARFYQLNGGTVAGAAVEAQASAAAANAGVGALVNAGARNISWLYGDSGTLPESDLVGGTAVRSAFSAAYNAATLSYLGTLASQGVMVHALDIGLVGANVNANLSEFGFIGEACPADTSCVIDQQLASQYVFYFDQLHLTSAGFAVFGEYVAAQLSAPLTLSASSELAMADARSLGLAMKNRMDTPSPRDGETADGLTFWVGGDAFSTSREMTMDTDPLKIQGFGVGGGLEYGFGTGKIGLMGRYGMPDSEYTGPSGAEAELTSISGGIYGVYSLGPVFLQAYGGMGSADHDLMRAGIVESLGRTAQTDGDHIVAGAKVGYLFGTGGVRVGPVAAIDHARVDVDGYTESGDPALNLIVDDISYSSTRGLLGLEIRGDAGLGEAILRPHGMIGIEAELNSDDRDFTFSQTSSPGIVNSWMVEGDDGDPYGRLAVGLTAGLSSAIHVDASLSTTISKNNGEESSAALSLSIGF